METRQRDEEVGGRETGEEGRTKRREKEKGGKA